MISAILLCSCDMMGEVATRRPLLPRHFASRGHGGVELRVGSFADAAYHADYAADFPGRPATITAAFSTPCIYFCATTPISSFLPAH